MRHLDHFIDFILLHYFFQVIIFAQEFQRIIRTVSIRQFPHQLESQRFFPDFAELLEQGSFADKQDPPQSNFPAPTSMLDQAKNEPEEEHKGNGHTKQNTQNKQEKEMNPDQKEIQNNDRICCSRERQHAAQLFSETVRFF